jgi:hypothetical protein
MGNDMTEVGFIRRVLNTCRCQRRGLPHLVQSVTDILTQLANYARVVIVMDDEQITTGTTKVLVAVKDS